MDRGYRQSQSNRESGIFVLMFPGGFERWLDDHLSDLQGVKGPEPHVAPEGFGGARMDR
jgi:hypothetical protein